MGFAIKVDENMERKAEDTGYLNIPTVKDLGHQVPCKVNGLTLYQMTKFRLLQLKSFCR